MFKEMFIEPFTDGDWMGVVTGILLWILALVIAGLLTQTINIFAKWECLVKYMQKELQKI
jgi:hypothetical protein